MSEVETHNGVVSYLVWCPETEDEKSAIVISSLDGGIAAEAWARRHNINSTPTPLTLATRDFSTGTLSFWEVTAYRGTWAGGTIVSYHSKLKLRS
jgi:hypothetical protein